MAHYKQIIPFVKKWEGGLSRDKSDSASAHPCPTPHKGVLGWHTNKGITYAVWAKNWGTKVDHRFFEMNDYDWGIIYKNGYWDKIKGDFIQSQSVANISVCMAWGSGPVQAGKIMQRACNDLGADLLVDGLIGNHSITWLNKLDEKLLFERLIERRELFFRELCKTTPRNEKFLKGWLNRLADLNKNFHPKVLNQ